MENEQWLEQKDGDEVLGVLIWTGPGLYYAQPPFGGPFYVRPMGERKDVPPPCEGPLWFDTPEQALY